MQFQFKIEIHGGGRGMWPRLGGKVNETLKSSIPYQNSSHHVGFISILVVMSWDSIWKWNWGTKSLKDFERCEEFSFEITYIITGGLRGIHDFFRSLRDEAAQVVFWHGGVHGNEFGTRLRPRLAIRGIRMRTHCTICLCVLKAVGSWGGQDTFFSVHLWGVFIHFLCSRNNVLIQDQNGGQNPMQTEL